MQTDWRCDGGRLKRGMHTTTTTTHILPLLKLLRNEGGGGVERDEERGEGFEKQRA